jgi:predicted DNA binding CopG/RHH family protein
MEKIMNKKKIPETDSIQELAHFWDTHDLTDFEDQLEEVNEPVFERETVLKIHLEPGEFEAVKQISRSRGISYTELIKEWVLERIHVK